MLPVITMDIYVCIKQVPDTTTRIKLQENGGWIDTMDVQWIISPCDEIAIEEALQLRDKHSGSTVTALSAGPARVADSLRMALAMGVDSGVHLDLFEQADSFLTARVLAAGVKHLGRPDIIFTGKEAIDDGAAQVSQLLAEFLDLPCVTVVQEIIYEEGQAVCNRSMGGGSREIIETRLPAVLAGQIGLNQPRYATALNIIKAKKKAIKTLTPDELGVTDLECKTRLKNFELPPPKAPCRLIAGEPREQASEIIRILREELKVI